MLEEDFNIETTEIEPELYGEIIPPSPVPVEQAQSLIEQALDEFRLKEHFQEYNSCTIIRNNKEQASATHYRMIFYMYDASTNKTVVDCLLEQPYVKQPVDYAYFKRSPHGKAYLMGGINGMKYDEHIVISVDVSGGNVTKVSSKFEKYGRYGWEGANVTDSWAMPYSTLMPLQFPRLKNDLSLDPVAKILQQAAASRVGLVLRNEVNLDVCTGHRYFTYTKALGKTPNIKVCHVYNGVNSTYPEIMSDVLTFNFDTNNPQKGWVFAGRGGYQPSTNAYPPITIYYSNCQPHVDRLISWGPPQLTGNFVEHPYEIGDTGYTDKDCDGNQIEPDVHPPLPEGEFPYKETKYLKYGFTQTKDLENCITFTAFEGRDDGRTFQLRGNEGKYLPYKKEEGCWHQYPLEPDSNLFNMAYKKDPVTNSKELYNFIMKKKEFEGEAKLIEGFPQQEYEAQFWSSSKGLYYVKFQEKSEEGDTVVIAFNRAETDTLYEIRGGWRLKKGADYKTKWTPEFDVQDWPTSYPITQGKDYYRGFRTNHKVLFNYLKRENMLNEAAQFVSPCTDPQPDGSLPPGIQGPDRPPKPQPPGPGGNDPLGPPKPTQPGDTGSISESNISECSGGIDDFNTRANQRLNGLYYYYLEENLFNSTPNRDNTSVLGTTNAIANVAYAPFLNINAGHLCKTEFDTKRFGSVSGKGTPWVFRIKSHLPVPMDVAKWNIYPKNKKPAIHPGTPWKWYYESRLLDYPYRKIAFYSNIFDMYDVIPHLHYQASESLTATLKACCPVTPGGNFYLYVDNYKGDKSGFTERQFTSTSMDIPNTSSAYSTYMATQKSQAANQIGIQPLLKTTGAIGGAALGAIVGSVVPGAGTAAGAAAGAVLGGGISMAGAVMDNMAKRADLMTTPKSLTSMGGDVIARLGNATKATVVSCDMEITDAYKDLLARYFHMFGTKQNRVLDVDSNINSRYYFNYIKTVGCSVSANGVPKRHVAKIKAVMDRGTTFWHLDRNGVKFGEYCVNDNVEMN